MVKVIVRVALEPIVSEGIALQIGLTNSYYLGNIFQVIFAICKYHFCDLQIPLICTIVVQFFFSIISTITQFPNVTYCTFIAMCNYLNSGYIQFAKTWKALIALEFSFYIQSFSSFSFNHFNHGTISEGQLLYLSCKPGKPSQNWHSPLLLNHFPVYFFKP